MLDRYNERSYLKENKSKISIWESLIHLNISKHSEKSFRAAKNVFTRIYQDISVALGYDLGQTTPWEILKKEKPQRDDEGKLIKTKEESD